MKPDALLTGLAAGAATALLFAGLVVQSPGAVGLALAAPIPVLLASLGWGSKSGFLAAFAAFVAVSAFVGSMLGGLTILLSVGLPAAIVGHVAGLARPIGDPQAPTLDWFPVRRILFAIAALIAAACIGLGWLSGYDPAEVGTVMTQALQTQSAETGVSPEQIEEFTRFAVTASPFVMPAFLVVTMVVCLYLSAAIVRLSGRLPRPRDDIPSSVGLPRAALAIFALALALCFVGGTIGIVAAVVVGAFAVAFTFVGLAAMHRRTRGRAGRGLILFTAYAGILLLSFPIVAFLVLGLFDTARSPARPATSA